MAESTEKPEGKKGGWFKTMIGTVAGLMSGAFMMYLSPLLDKVVRPAKPVANFAVDVQGLTVQFHNRSSSRAEGWWDFGDGSPLEPVNADNPTVVHTYAKPGTYTVKLSLRNLLNEEHDRTVTINLDSANTDPPAILALEAIPVSGSFYAPATFRLVSKMKNTSLCVWETDPDRPLDIIPDPPAEQDRLVTYNEPGGYVVKLVAVNGKQAKEKSIIVQVMEPPTGAVTAVLHITEQMVKVDKADRRVTLTESFGGNASATSMPINRKIDARLGWEITAARLDPGTGKGTRKLQLKVAPDKKFAILTGELVREGSVPKNQASPPTAIAGMITEEKRSVVRGSNGPVTAMLTVPGATVVTLPDPPCDCTDVQRQYRLELHEAGRPIWQDSRLPAGVLVTIQNRRFLLKATPIGNQVRIEVQEPIPGRNVAVN